MLAWIQNDSHKQKPVVGNKVAEIQRLTDPAHLHHCVEKDNPAGLVTRGISAEKLLQSDIWLHGPTFLLAGPIENLVTVCSESSDETVCTTGVALGNQVVTTGVSESVIPISSSGEEFSP
mgnify:CR=1 FL=1